MKKSTILKQARKLIKSGEEEFVCIALQEVSYHYGQNHSDEAWEKVEQQTKELRAWISGLLNHHATLSGWLETIHGIDDSFEDKRKIQATRLAWLDWMIAQYQIKEKRIFEGPWGLKRCKK